VSARERDAAAVETRLTDAALSGEQLEVILVLRGRVRRTAGDGRWRIRALGGHAVTFPSGAVVAATPVTVPARSRR
jgi:hypothetical protein